MDKTSEIISEEEFEWLDQFLLDRIPEDSETPGKDEGVLDMSELDGLLTAVVSGPVSVPPSKWVPAVWGDYEPEWEDAKEFEKVLSIMIRHMNYITTLLMDYPDEYEPMFLQRDVEEKTYEIVDEWCEGYLRGVNLTKSQWDAGGQEMETLLEPVLAFTGATKWRGHDMSETENDKMRNALTPNVRAVHAYWLARRDDNIPSSQTVRSSEPRVGRNDPCPCGSGKKYKKCCLH